MRHIVQRLAQPLVWHVQLVDLWLFVEAVPQSSRRRGVAEEPTIDSREATPAEDAQSEDEEAGAVDRLVDTFKELEKLLNGIQLGTSTSSHILLGL